MYCKVIKRLQSKNPEDTEITFVNFSLAYSFKKSWASVLDVGN